METECTDTLDMSRSKLKKLPKPTSAQSQVQVLVLDENDLSRLDNLDFYLKLQKLSAVRNQLLRMNFFSRLHCLHTLNLAHNQILCIEGIKELANLRCLCLADNNIKTIEHLNENSNLEHLDLSENQISHISDMSFLVNLKELLLHENRINHLQHCDHYLPTSLTTLNLASNEITDLNQISHLVNLTNLTNLSIQNNPCVAITKDSIFDYRPFLINWCCSLKEIDGYLVGDLERLRGEGLFCQGKGRQYRIGEHQELVQYLAISCPLSGKALETEDERKLRRILSKAQYHQKQLREQLQSGETSLRSPASNRKIHSNKNSPRLTKSRFSGRNRSPDPSCMISSCYTASSLAGDGPTLMSQSLDPSLLSQNIIAKLSNSSSSTINSSHSRPSIADEPKRPVEEAAVEVTSCPLQAATKLVPVPESLMSPDYRPSKSLVDKIHASKAAPVEPKKTTPKPSRLAQPVVRATSNAPASAGKRPQSTPKMGKAAAPPHQEAGDAVRSDKECNRAKDVIDDAPKSVISTPAVAPAAAVVVPAAGDVGNGKASTTSAEVDAATRIQKMWRGYYVRNRNKQTIKILKTIQAERTRQYILKLSSDMESTKAALESERKIQVLQMQAINALWKKVSALQPRGDDNNDSQTAAQIENADVVKDLAMTCSLLHSQVQQLQGSMQDVVKCMSMFCQLPAVSQQLRENGIATQTEISAVHTPQGEAAKVFPYLKTPRPSSLPLPERRTKLPTPLLEKRDEPKPTTEDASTTAEEDYDDASDGSDADPVTVAMNDAKKSPIEEKTV